MQSYDPDICYMEWPDGDWLWIQNWDNSLTPIPIPNNYSQAEDYICDNQLHELEWSDWRTGKRPNRYLCACGQPLSTNADCTGRCDVPWTATFEKRCNVVTQLDTKGNFSTYGGSQGTCLRVAGERNVQLFGQNPIDVDVKNLKTSDLIVVDGSGLTQVCSNENADRGNGRICNCDGALPEVVWGRSVKVQDACGLDKGTNKDWIAAPILGGIALLGFITILIHFYQRRKSLEKIRSTQFSNDEYSLKELSVSGIRNRSIAVTSSNSNGLREVPSSSSGASQQSYDSGVALIETTGSRKIFT